MRVPALAKIGLGLIVAGALIGAAGWYWAPTTDPVRQYVSLAKGHVEIPEFEVNNEREYWITADFNDIDSADLPGCDALKGSRPAIRTHTVVTRAGTVVSETDSQNWEIGTFTSRPGRYKIRVDVISNSSCLQKPSAWLSVWCNADPDPFHTRGWSALFIILGIGILLPVRSITKPIALPPEIAPPNTSVPERLPRRIVRPLQARMSALPSFGTLATVIFFFAVVGLMLCLAWIHDHSIPKGLGVSVSSKLYERAKGNREIAPLTLSVERHGEDVRYLLDGENVRLEDLRRALKGELARRADWIVFVEGDASLPYQDVTQLIDIASGLHAKVVMLTQGMKQEVSRQVPRAIPPTQSSKQ